MANTLRPARKWLKRRWWLISAAVGLLAASGVLLRVSAGRYEVQRQALLNDYVSTLELGANDARQATRFRDLADALGALIEAGAVDERNLPLARYLAARSRLHAAETQLNAALARSPYDRSSAGAFATLEEALRDPSLYADSDSFRPEVASLLNARLADDRLNRADLVRRVEDFHRRMAARSLSLGDPLGAWPYLKLIHEHVSYSSPEGALLLALPSLGSRAVAARAATIEAFAVWLRDPGASANKARFRSNLKAWRRLSADLGRESALAAASLADARARFSSTKADLARRESELTRDIRMISRGAWTPEQERRRLARYYDSEQELERALRLESGFRVARLKERRRTLALEVGRARAGARSLESFEAWFQEMLRQEMSEKATITRERIAGILADSPSLHQALVRPAIDAGLEPRLATERVARALQGVLLSDLYVISAGVRRHAGDRKGATALLAELSGHYVALADLVGFEPSIRRRLTLPPSLAEDAGQVEFALIDDVITRLTRAAAEAPSPQRRDLAMAGAELLRTLRAALFSGSFELARLRRQAMLATLAQLSGKDRPTQEATDPQTGEPLLAKLEQRYFAQRDQALRAFERYAAIDDPAVRTRANFGIVNVLLDDARYGHEFLVSLDPDGLSAFRRDGESINHARARLRMGPDRELRLRAARLIADLEKRVEFSTDPELWVAIRFRKGQLRELTPIDARRNDRWYYLGDFAGAVRDVYLPLLSSGVLTGKGRAAALDNSTLPLRQFFAAYSDKLDRLLRELPVYDFENSSPGAQTLPELARVEALLRQIGGIADHVALMRAVAVLDPSLADVPLRIAQVYRAMGELVALHAELLRRGARLAEALAESASSRELYRRAAEGLADWTLALPPGHAEPEHWVAIGLDYLRSRDYLFALAALRRYVDARRDSDRTNLRAVIYQVVSAMGRAYEALDLYEGSGDHEFGTPGYAIDGAIPAYAWIAHESAMVLKKRGELPLPALGAFIGLARARYRLGLRDGDIEQFRTAIQELETHIIKGTIFEQLPADLDRSSAWRDAQYLRGLCALELARAARLQGSLDFRVFNAHLELASASFEDLVQRFHEETGATLLDAQFRHAQTEWMRAVHEPLPLSAEGAIEPLKRASARLRGLLMQLDELRERASRTGGDPHRRLDLETRLMLGDVNELLARRLEKLYQLQPQSRDPLASRRRYQAAIQAYERVDRAHPGAWQNAWALSQRIACFRALGRAAAADEAIADDLLARADSLLDRISDDAWARAPQAMDKDYWKGYFAWSRRNAGAVR